MSRISFIVPLVVVALACELGYAQTVAYQGRLEDAATGPLDGDYDFQFRLFDDPVAGSERWSEDQVQVPVVGGLFSVGLGSVTAFPAALWTDYPNLYLEVAVRVTSEPPGTGAWTFLRNRQAILHVPRAVHAIGTELCEVRQSSTSSAGVNAFGPICAGCLPGTKLVAGGFNGEQYAELNITQSYPGANQWCVGGYNNTGGARTVTAYAVCCP